MRNLRARVGAGLGLLAAVLVVPFAATLPTAAAQDTVVVDNGHVDAVAPRIIDGRLQVQYKDGSRPDAPVWREPGTVVTHVKPESRMQVPEGPDYAFLGDPGDDLWMIPQTQIPGIVWAGWNTEELGAATVSGDVTLGLSKVDGPGNVAVFLTGQSPTVVFNAADGLPDTLRVPLGTHAHANWGFAAEGIYRLTFTVTATLASGKTQTDTDTYTFTVGNVDPSTALGGRCGGGGPTSTSTSATSTTQPGPTSSDSDGAPGPQGGTQPLAKTGVGGLSYLVPIGALMLAGGVALLILFRRRPKQSA
jgi:putative ABC transporter-associated repeat protein